MCHRVDINITIQLTEGKKVTRNVPSLIFRLTLIKMHLMYHLTE